LWRLLLDPSKDNCFDQVEDPRQRSQRGDRVILFARGAPDHTDCCGTRRSDNPVRAS
jgi:hypothetical protein